MNKDDLKIYLNKNVEILKDLLEYIGLKHIRKIRDEYLSCGFSGSRRRDSVNIYLNNKLSVKIWSRNDNVKDIYGLTQLQMNCSFFEAIEIVSGFCGIKIGNRKTKKIESFMRKPKIEKVKYERPISKNILKFSTDDCFVKGISDLFLKDGISEETQEIFDIGIDTLDNRIVFPVRDYEGNILTFKGRTLDINYINNGTPKYLYYHNCNSRHYLFGYYENYKYIEESEYLIIVESEKSVMQLHTIGYRNAVATSKKRISIEQLEEINALGKKIVLAYDNDVDLYEIQKECSKFNNEVYYLKDTKGLLGLKDSPSDRGKEVFETLYKNKFKYER